MFMKEYVAHDPSKDSKFVFKAIDASRLVEELKTCIHKYKIDQILCFVNSTVETIESMIEPLPGVKPPV